AVVVWLLFFFFSSRRRHTRSKRDWSSDVCSSDLRRARKYGPQAAQVEFLDLRVLRQQHRDGRCDESEGHAETFVGGEEATQLEKIGRASCRERVEEERGK